MRVTARCPRKATEDPERVRTALLHLFPDALVEESAGEMRAVTGSLEAVRQRIRDQRIRDSARGELIRGREDDVLRFRLNKQAAFAGRVSFSSGSPLGDIEVVVEDADLDALIDDVAESTTGKRLKG